MLTLAAVEVQVIDCSGSILNNESGLSFFKTQKEYLFVNIDLLMKAQGKAVVGERLVWDGY